MKYFSFKILIICIVLPPILNLFVIKFLEEYYKRQFTYEIENVCASDTKPLLDGRLPLIDAVNRNIDMYLQKKVLIKWGVKPSVTVTTRKKTLIYPAYVDENDEYLNPPTRKEVAAENYRLMSEGLVVTVIVHLERGSLINIFIFLLFILISVLILYLYYRAGAQKANQEEIRKKLEIERLTNIEKEQGQKLLALRKDQDLIAAEYQRIKHKLESEKLKADKNEDDMLNEIISLEEKFAKIHQLYEHQINENKELKEHIEQYELEKENQKKNKRFQKSVDLTQKRFKALYKNIRIHEKAIAGFEALREDIRIKAEEIISQLNLDMVNVNVKRKLLMKRSKDAVFEVQFSNEGRLYFCKSFDNKAFILVIGTKKTQNKDLIFLDHFNP